MKPKLKFTLPLFAALLCALCCVADLAAQTAVVPRPEHPRPDMVRADWQTLNGQWEFDFDDTDRGIAEGWHKGSKAFSRRITVPYAFQTRLSGIGDTAFHDVVWYRRAVQVPGAFRANNKRVMMHFGAVDYEATVWVNGEQVGHHRGGHVPFAVDITDALRANDNSVCVRVVDPSEDVSVPRGKQYWRPKSEAIFYTRTTGIWQPVWLESVAPAHIKRLKITPDVDNSQVSVETILHKPPTNRSIRDARVRMTIKLAGAVRAQAEATANNGVIANGASPVSIIKLFDQQLWSPERPTLYDIEVELVGADGQVLDRVASYFGQRKVSVHNNQIYLNNAPYYLRMVLDQGYWQESTLTPPTDEAIQYDIKMTKAFGFNGARKHQKVEDPRWLYWCDRLGLAVWGEAANAYLNTDAYIARFQQEWQESVERDYNHPSIIAWTPINESWGVGDILTDAKQQAHAKAMYYMTRSLDATRLVQDNDGWEHTDTTDIFGIHDYAGTGADFDAKYKILETDRTAIPRNGREALAYGYKYNGSPIMLTEFGGIAYRIGAPRAANEFGYGNTAPSKEAFLTRLGGLVKAVRANKAIVGYCYTQLTDVEQEINGLMTYDRKLKATPEEFRRIFGN